MLRGKPLHTFSKTSFPCVWGAVPCGILLLFSQSLVFSTAGILKSGTQQKFVWGQIWSPS